MALAALDDFKRAMEIKRDTMTAAKRSGLNAAHERMAENLRLYEAGQPCRRPWKSDESVFLSERPSPPLSNLKRAGRGGTGRKGRKGGIGRRGGRATLHHT